MRYSAITLSTLSLFAGGIYAITCNSAEQSLDAYLDTKCDMNYVGEIGAWRADCGWGTLEWVEGTNGQYGKVTLRSVQDGVVGFIYKTKETNGVETKFLATLDGKTECTRGLPAGATVADVTSDLAQ